MRLTTVPRETTDRGALQQIADGFRHVRSRRELLWPCLMAFVVTSLAWEFPITLPLLARDTFQADARLYGWLMACMGVGAVLGALVIARSGRTGLVPISTAAAVFGSTLTVLAVAPTAELALVAMVGVGASGSAFLSTSNATIQLASDDALRGRVMSIWSLCFLGSTPIGGPIVGVIGELDPRWAIAAGALACAAAAIVLLVVGRSTTVG